MKPRAESRVEFLNPMSDFFHFLFTFLTEKRFKCSQFEFVNKQKKVLDFLRFLLYKSYRCELFP
jgi:hypothetical protein